VLIPGINMGVNRLEVLLSGRKVACGLPQPACEKPKSAPVGRVKAGVAEPLGDALTLMTGALVCFLLSSHALGSRTASKSTCDPSGSNIQMAVICGVTPIRPSKAQTCNG
jgi:hypothetical protein